MDKKVRHEVVLVDDKGTIDVDADPLGAELMQIESENHFYCSLLSSRGCDGSVFKEVAPRKQIKRRATATERLSTEYQNELASLSTAGAHFRLGGATLSSNEFFVERERKRQSERIKELEERKTNVETFLLLKHKGELLMEQHQVAEKGVKHIGNSDLKELVKWKLFGTDVSMKGSTRKADLVKLWEENPLPTAPFQWSSTDEETLNNLKKDDISLTSTALGREHEMNANCLIGGILTGAIRPEVIQQLKTALENSANDRDNLGLAYSGSSEE